MGVDSSFSLPCSFPKTPGIHAGIPAPHPGSSRYIWALAGWKEARIHFMSVW